jgi:DNA-binding transcriptional ArsR family regulator
VSEPYSPELDLLLRALADPTRRRLYRLLGSKPGMTTHELAAQVPGMTRWGVMKHLAQLREAGLVQTLPEGRRRRHFREEAALVPLRRWLDAADG